MRLLVAVLALLLLAAPARAQLPPGILAEQRQAEADCRSAGGRPRAMPAFRATLDLNGDGQPDYVHDYTALDCDGAASYFCGSAGCPIVVFISPAYRPEALGHSRSWTVDRTGPLPVIVLATHGSGCGRVGSADCEMRVAWNGSALAPLGSPRSPAPPRIAAAPRPALAPAPSAGTKDPVPVASAAPAAAWQLLRGSDGTPIAVAPGPGVVRSVSVLCHGEAPVLALVVRARPPEGPVTLSLAVPGRAGQASAPLLPGMGETWFAELRGTPMARMLVSNQALDLRINGGLQGRVGLQNAGTSIREALATCLRL